MEYLRTCKSGVQGGDRVGMENERLTRLFPNWNTKTLEKDILAHLVDFLEKFHVQYSRNVHVRLVTTKAPDGTKVHRPVRLRDSQKGKPDLFVFIPMETIDVETKKPITGRLTPDQQKWRDKAEKNGRKYFA